MAIGIGSTWLDDYEKPKEPVGYYIEDNPNGKNAERVKYFGIIKIVWWPLLDGPIDFYLNHPEDFIVTPIYK